MKNNERVNMKIVEPGRPGRPESADVEATLADLREDFGTQE